MSKNSNVTYRVYKNSQGDSNAEFVPIKVKSGSKAESKHKLREARNEAGITSQPQNNPIKEMMMYPPPDSDEEEPELILDPKSDLFGFPDDGYDYTQHLDRITGDGVYIPSGGMKSENVEEGIDLEILKALENDEADEVYEVDSNNSDDYKQVYGHKLETDSDNETNQWFNEGIKPEDVIKTTKKRKTSSSQQNDNQETEEVMVDSNSRHDTTNQYDFENEGRELLEERFAEVMKMYDDEEIGELEDDDPTVQGTEDVRDHYAELEEFWDEQNLPTWHQREQMLEKEREKEEEQEKILEQLELPEGMAIATKKKPKDITRREVAQIVKERFLNEDEESSNSDYEEVEVSKSPDYDIESFHSMHSNAYNHPSIISEEITQKKKPKIQLSKQGIPIGVLGTEKQNQNDNNINEQNESKDNVNLGKKRPKKESKEEKRQRKKQIKQQKREKRQRKKQLKNKFHAEEQRQSDVVRHRESQKKTIVQY